MRVEITNRRPSKYAVMLRLYCGMTAFTAFCAATALEIWRLRWAAFAAAAVCVIALAAAAAVPLCVGRVSYVRSGGCLKIEKGLIFCRTTIVNRSDIRCSEIRRGPLQRRMGICTVVFFTGGRKIRLRGVSLGDGNLLNRSMCGEAAA